MNLSKVNGRIYIELPKAMKERAGVCVYMLV